MTLRTFGFSIVIFVFSIVNIYTQDFNRANEPKTQSTISVYGTGTLLVQPDIIQMTISLNKTEKTTQLAQQEVSRMVRRALSILKENNIEDRNINTTSLKFRPVYEYKLTRRVLTGQRAEQIITFIIENIINNDEKVTKIIDSLTQINGLELNQVNYNVKNKTEYSNKSRELAFQDAVEKANLYAELSNLKIVKVLSISEEKTQQPISTGRGTSDRLYYSESNSDTSTILPLGEIELTTSVMIVFLLE